MCNHSDYWRCKPLLTVDKGGSLFSVARLQHCQKKTPQSNLVCVAHINKCFWGCKLDVQMCNHGDYWRCKPLLTVDKGGSLFSVARLQHCQKKTPQSNLVCVAHINKCFWGCKLDIQMCNHSDYWRCKPLLSVDKGGSLFFGGKASHCQKKTPQSNLVCVAHINKCFWGCKLDIQMCNHSDYWRCKPLLTV